MLYTALIITASFSAMLLSQAVSPDIGWYVPVWQGVAAIFGVLAVTNAALRGRARASDWIRLTTLCASIAATALAIHAALGEHVFENVKHFNRVVPLIVPFFLLAAQSFGKKSSHRLALVINGVVLLASFLLA